MLISSFRGRPAGGVRHTQAVCCHYFLSCRRLPSQHQSLRTLGQYQFILCGEQRHLCVNDLPIGRCMTSERPGHHWTWYFAYNSQSTENGYATTTHQFNIRYARKHYKRRMITSVLDHFDPVVTLQPGPNKDLVRMLWPLTQHHLRAVNCSLTARIQLMSCVKSTRLQSNNKKRIYVTCSVIGQRQLVYYIQLYSSQYYIRNIALITVIDQR